MTKQQEFSVSFWNSSTIGRPKPDMGRKRKVITEETQEVPVSKQSLPPCRVCEGPAAGFHYGANTCDACKIFFYRSIKLFPKFRCVSGGKCKVKYNEEKLCSKCRFAKCIAAGMNREAIKRGRYTTTKRTNDILEVKRLQRLQSCNPRVLDLSLKSHHQQRSESTSLQVPTRLVECQLCGQTTCSHGQNISSQESEDMLLDPSHQESSTCVDGPNPPVLSCEHASEASAIRSLFKDKDSVTKALCDAKHQMSYSVHKALAEKHKRFDRDKWRRMFSKQNQLGATLCTLSHRMKFHVKVLVNFALCIPGFKSLNHRTQTKLVRSSRFETMCVTGTPDYHTHLAWIWCRTMGSFQKILLDKKILHEDGRDEEDLYRELRAIHQRYIDLGLTQEELATFCAILVMAPDREPYVFCGRVRQTYEELNECLIHLLCRRSPKGMQIYAKVVDVMVQSRAFFNGMERLFDAIDKFTNPQDHPLYARRRKILGYA